MRHHHEHYICINELKYDYYDLHDFNEYEQQHFDNADDEYYQHLYNHNNDCSLQRQVQYAPAVVLPSYLCQRFV